MKKLILLLAVGMILISFTVPDEPEVGIDVRLSILEVTIEADMKAGLVDPGVGKAYLFNLTKCRTILRNERRDN